MRRIRGCGFWLVPRDIVVDGGYLSFAISLTMRTPAAFSSAVTAFWQSLRKGQPASGMRVSRLMPSHLPRASGVSQRSQNFVTGPGVDDFAINRVRVNVRGLEIAVHREL
jgi:hypothetical protein